MTTESNKPVYTHASHAPWREILWQRWSGRLDRALVLRDLGGVYHLVGARRATSPGAALYTGEAPKETAAFRTRTRLRGYDSAFLVQLGEHVGTRAVALPTHYGTESLAVQALWWVHDPVQVVRSRTTHGWLAVRKALEGRSGVARGALADQAPGSGQSGTRLDSEPLQPYPGGDQLAGRGGRPVGQADDAGTAGTLRNAA